MESHGEHVVESILHVWDIGDPFPVGEKSLAAVKHCGGLALELMAFAAKTPDDPDALLNIIIHPLIELSIIARPDERADEKAGEERLPSDTALLTPALVEMLCMVKFPHHRCEARAKWLAQLMIEYVAHQYMRDSFNWEQMKSILTDAEVANWRVYNNRLKDLLRAIRDTEMPDSWEPQVREFIGGYVTE